MGGGCESAAAAAPRAVVVESVLELIGNTPCVRLSRFVAAEGVEEGVEIYGKCEFMNPGGSVKDRIAQRMIEEAEDEGELGKEKGVTLVEPTSGNTGIGMCLVGAVKGYKVVATMPEKMSGEKVNIMKRLGGEIIRTKTEMAWDDERSHIGIAKKMVKEGEGKVKMLDQYGNKYNPKTHYEKTGEELIRQMEGRLDVVFIGAGTGGTLTGIGKKVKEKIPKCKVIGIDPCGSILAEPEILNEYKKFQPNLVEGIGYDFIPQVLDRSVVDEWIKVDDEEAFMAARNLIKYEGLLVGGSAGSVVAGMMKWIKRQATGRLKCAVILPDSCRNYMTKFIDDDWMIDHDFMEASEKRDCRAKEETVEKVKWLESGMSVRQAKKWFLREKEEEEVVVIDEETGNFQGLLSLDIICGYEGDEEEKVEELPLKRRAKMLKWEESIGDKKRLIKGLEMHRTIFVVEEKTKEVWKWKGRITRRSFVAASSV